MSRRPLALGAASLSLASLWWFAAPSAPRWLERAALPLAFVAAVLAVLARPRQGGAVAVLALMTLSASLVVLATELTFTLLARM